jgi:hypothetical protein
MITKQRRLFGRLFLCGLVSFWAPVCAQEPPDKAEKELQRKQELEQKAYALLDEIATGAHGLKLPENRSFVLTSAADLLWAHDEKRARSLFWDALGSVNLMTQPGGDGGPSKQSSKQKDQKRYFAIFALKQALLRKVARHDPQLAVDMLRSTRQLPAEQINASFRLPDDSELEQQIATEAAALDPQQALQLARGSLAKGLTFQLLELVDRLNARDQDVAAKFAGDIISKLETKNLAADISASRIAVDLVAWSRKPSGSSLEKDPVAAKAYQLKLDTEKRRHLVEMIANAALGVSPNSILLNSIHEIMPEIQEFVPERIALLQKKVSAFEQTLSKEQRGWNNYNSLVRSGSPEDMIAASIKADDEQRQMLRGEAILAAIFRRRTDALREFIKTEIEDDSARRSLLDDLDSQEITAAMFRGEVDELRTLLPRVRRSEERARAMAEIAVVLEKKGDHEEAVKLLDEARTLIKVDFESETQTNALFALAAAYALVEPPKAFAIIERTIDRANDQISKALLLDKIVKTGVVRKGEILLHNSGVISPDLMMFRYGKAVVAMANADFNRTKAVADRLDRLELRLLARLLLAQALLPKDERRTR